MLSHIYLTSFKPSLSVSETTNFEYSFSTITFSRFSLQQYQIFLCFYYSNVLPLFTKLCSGYLLLCGDVDQKFSILLLTHLQIMHGLVGKFQICSIWCQLEQFHYGSFFKLVHSHGWQEIVLAHGQEFWQVSKWGVFCFPCGALHSSFFLYCFTGWQLTFKSRYKNRGSGSCQF